MINRSGDFHEEIEPKTYKMKRYLESVYSSNDELQ